MTDSRNGGFTLIELLLVVAIIGIISAVALPGLARARLSSEQASACGSLRAVNSGEMTFRYTCGNGAYSPTLQNLSLPPAGGTGFISPDLGSLAPVRKSGYQFDLGTATPNPVLSCNGGTTANSYHATAEPLSPEGRRSFGTNGSGTIFESPNPLVGVMPDVGSPPAPATPLQR